jgi:hypothetical protein
MQALSQLSYTPQTAQAIHIAQINFRASDYSLKKSRGLEPADHGVTVAERQHRIE